MQAWRYDADDLLFRESGLRKRIFQCVSGVYATFPLKKNSYKNSDHTFSFLLP